MKKANNYGVIESDSYMCIWIGLKRNDKECFCHTNLKRHH